MSASDDWPLSQAALEYLSRLQHDTPEQLAQEHPEPEVLEAEYWEYDDPDQPRSPYRSVVYDDDEELDAHTDSWLAAYDELEDGEYDEEPRTLGTISSYFRKLNYRGAHRANG